MAVQDDVREREMVLLFNLTVQEGRGRSDVDAHLALDDGQLLPFELKSTSKTSISTVRDFGPEHIAKWRDLHWLFAFYDDAGQRLRYCYYASPADMAGWIEAKERYVLPDMVLAQSAQDLVDDGTLSRVLGTAASFASSDARLIMKNQWTSSQYLERADLPEGRYSRARMVELLQARCAYVIRRGATLNNPHISESYFVEQGLERIDRDHAATLRHLVRHYLESGRKPLELDPAIQAQAIAASTDEATA